MWKYRYTDELYHYGVKGMKWHQRRKIQLVNRNSPLNDPSETYIYSPGSKGYHTDPLQRISAETFNNPRYSKQDRQSGKVFNDYTKRTQAIKKESQKKNVKKTAKRNVHSIISKSLNRKVKKRAG